MSDRLGTAQWEDPSVVSQKYPYAPGTFWLGRADDGSAIGYADDRHICLVSGTRGGKGASIIVNNLCMWPGSAVVVDPKGENATITAARRGHGSGTVAKHNTADGSGTDRYRVNSHWTDYSDGTDYPPLQGEASGESDGAGSERYLGRGYGSDYCVGMGQAVHVLDPFKAAQVEERYRSSFNPFDVLDPEKEETLDEANRIASAIIVVRENAAEPFWDEAARDMLRGLILYVLTAEHFSDDERNLITVRKLILNGEWQIQAAIRAQGHDEGKIDPPHLLLWRAMERSTAFDGLVSGLGSRFRSTMKSEKMYEGVLQSAVVNTEFLDSPGMRRVLCKSDFKLAELKTRPEGMTLYLSLPQRFMETHYRWLRMMVALTVNEMEIHPGRPSTGYPVLMVLDEFAGLKRMTMIENAVAQLAGFGVKLFYVLQSFEQLKGIYKDHWETFVANAGIKIIFSVSDPFSQKYVSTMAGETEVIRELSSVSESQSENESFSEGTSQSTSTGVSYSHTEGGSRSRNQSATQGTNSSKSVSHSSGTSTSIGWRKGWIRDRIYDGRGQTGWNSGTTHGISEGRSSSFSQGFSEGTSYGDTSGTSTSDTTSNSQNRTRGASRTAGTTRGESVHRRPLLQPDEVGRFFTRIDDKSDPAYPGLGLVLVTGADPLVVRRTNYFEDPQFIRCFSPHPDHQFLALPSTGFDDVKYRNLLDSYWYGTTSLEQARRLLRAQLDDLEKTHTVFCGTIQHASKKMAEWYCRNTRYSLEDIFAIARDEKSKYANQHPQHPPIYLHELMDCVVAGSKIPELFAYPETRPFSTTDPDNITSEDLRILFALVPTKVKFPNIRAFSHNPLPSFFSDLPITPPLTTVPELDLGAWIKKKLKDFTDGVIWTVVLLVFFLALFWLWDKIHGR